MDSNQPILVRMVSFSCKRIGLAQMGVKYSFSSFERHSNTSKFAISNDPIVGRNLIDVDTASGQEYPEKESLSI